MKTNQQAFAVATISRDDIAKLHLDRNGNEPHWARELSDQQLATIAVRMRRYLAVAPGDTEYALREAVHDVRHRRFISLQADGEAI